METQKENNEPVFLKTIIVVILLGVIGYFVFNNLNQNSVSSDSTQHSKNKTTQATTLSDAEMCKQYAQKEADSANLSTKQYYSIQSFNYSNLEKICYYEIHYQMNINSQGNTIVSQVYQLEAVSKDSMESSFKYDFPANGSQEASCIVPETYYQGAVTNCKYYGLEQKINLDGSTSIYQKYSFLGNDTPPMTYLDYKTLLQKRMSN